MEPPAWQQVVRWVTTSSTRSSLAMLMASPVTVNRDSTLRAMPSLGDQYR